MSLCSPRAGIGKHGLDFDGVQLSEASERTDANSCSKLSGEQAVETSEMRLADQKMLLCFPRAGIGKQGLDFDGVQMPEPSERIDAMSCPKLSGEQAVETSDMSDSASPQSSSQVLERLSCAGEAARTCMLQLDRQGIGNIKLDTTAGFKDESA